MGSHVTVIAVAMRRPTVHLTMLQQIATGLSSHAAGYVIVPLISVQTCQPYCGYLLPRLSLIRHYLASL